MLILAGVSISAIVGEDGILSKTKQASIASKKASILEALNMELTSYNIDTMLNSPEETSAMLSNLKDKGLIDKVLSSSGPTTDTSQALGIPQFDDSNQYTGYTDYGVIKDDYSILLSVDMSGIYKANFGEVNVSAGGSVAAGTTVVTSNAFENGSGTEKPEDKGKFTIDNDASVMFVDEVDGELSIQVKSGTHAKVNIFKDMTLSNTGVQRSAIDIEPNGILDLYIADGVKVNVNSGLGEKGDGVDNSKSNKGGYAGIHVPEGATLNLNGSGTLTAIGGDAGDGNMYVEGGKGRGGSGGGGAGAGIGGNGGDGTGYASGKGSDGGAGENCGNVNIYETLTIFAYGGGGGSGADGTVDVGSGGGGYPAAGIGGGGAGGAGGTCCVGGGGYSGGGGDGYLGTSSNPSGNRGYGGKGGVNGESGERLINSYWGLFSGGGYDVEDVSLSSQYAYDAGITTVAGGLGGKQSVNADGSGHVAGNGGTGGTGGIVKVSNGVILNAYNGNKYTDDAEGHEYNNGINQTEIYAQNGIINKRYNITKQEGADVRYTVECEYNATGIPTTLYINPTSKNHQGIGSGAGYIEVSNGNFEIMN